MRRLQRFACCSSLSGLFSRGSAFALLLSGLSGAIEGSRAQAEVRKRASRKSRVAGRKPESKEDRMTMEVMADAGAGRATLPDGREEMIPGAW